MNKKEVYEVKLNPQGSDLRRLKNLTGKLNIKEFRIISKNYSDLENVIYGFML